MTIKGKQASDLQSAKYKGKGKLENKKQMSTKRNTHLLLSIEETAQNIKRK